MKIAERTAIVRKENSAVSDDYTVTKKATAAISNNFVALQNSFNIILANSINIKALQEAQAKKTATSSLSEGIVAPTNGKIVGAEELSGTINVLGKYFDQLTKLFDNLDITPPEDDEEDGVNRRRRGRKSRGGRRSRGRSRNMRGRGPIGKALGVFDTVLGVTDDVIDEGDEPVVDRGRGATRGILKGAAIGVGIAGAGYLASKAFSSKPSAKETESDKRLKQSVAKTATVPAARVPSQINNDSYSSRFADYLADTFENVKSYIGGIVGSIFSGDDGGGGYYPDDGSMGEGMTGNAQIAMDYFTSPEGGEWTREQAAGIIANLQAESGLNPNAFNPAGGGQGAQGIAQWRGPRITRFVEIYNKPVRNASLQEQLEYVNWELNNTEAAAGRSLRSATTAEEATNIIYRQYERPDEHDRSGGKRISNARAIMEVVNNPGNPDGVGLVSPLPGAKATSEFGVRTHPILGTRRMHQGLDFGADMNTPILAAGSGTVIFAGTKSGYGNTIDIDHGGGIVTRYAHMSSFIVRKGAQVNQGQSIGRVGSTGLSTGPHLHFEVHRNGKQEDPRSYLNVIRAPASSLMTPSRASLMANQLPLSTSKKYFESLRANPRRGNGSLIMMNNQPSPYSAQSFFPTMTPRGGTRSSNPSFADFYSSYHGVNR